MVALVLKCVPSRRDHDLATSAIGESALQRYEKRWNSLLEIDYETDSVIQQSLRTRVAKGVTLLTVAHRLQTIMDYDKIVSSVSTPALVCASRRMLPDGPGCR